MGVSTPTKAVVINHGKSHKGSKKHSKGGSKKIEDSDDGVDVNEQLTASFPDVGAFPFASYVGKVGLGSGIYLGNGYVLTSAHVGCFPFVADDESVYKPKFETWQILESSNGKQADLAVFQVNNIEPDSLLSHLTPLAFSSRQPEPQDLMVLVGSGLVQSREPVEIKSGDKVLGILGYRIQDHRETIAGLNTVGKVLESPIHTGNFETDCFVSQFGRNPNEAQAVDGDSGGASFLYNHMLKRWELAGCIIAVSQSDHFVPFGSQTYFADLNHYTDALVVATHAAMVADTPVDPTLSELTQAKLNGPKKATPR